METNLSRLLNFLSALVLVGFMGCGGNTPSDHKSSKSDGTKTGGTQNKPKATKFTPEMVKAALEAAMEQLPNSGTKEERAFALEPKNLQARVDDLNESIVEGKVKHRALKIDAITVEALTKAFVAQIAPVKVTPNKERQLLLSANRVKNLAAGLEAFRGENEGRYPVADKWCDAIFGYTGSTTTIVYFSPRHPDFAKLKDSLPKPGKQEAETTEPEPEGKRMSHYAFNKALSGKDYDVEVVLAFECDLGWNGAGGLEDALKYMDKLKLEKIPVETTFNSSRIVTREELKKLKWELSP